jgi:Dolichyl-phosphate-mannose-protein mannosyltransferase
MLLLIALLATRLPALVEPAGNDQSLYAYGGARLLAGDVPYRDVWDQKPPGIFAVYAALWAVVPNESVVAVGDLVAASLTAWLLVVLGRRTVGVDVGYAAAAIFLLFGHPAMARNSGAYVRGQCEVFIALFVTAALASLARRERRWWHLWMAGAALGAAFWLKYNALAYGLPAALLVWLMPGATPTLRRVTRELAMIGAAFALVVGMGLAWFAAHGAIDDLWLATIRYNALYSSETYTGIGAMLAYPFMALYQHAHVDMLWFLGSLGGLLLIPHVRRRPEVLVILGWIAAAVVSISANGARNLPQYFVQAGPALAFAAAAGLATWSFLRPAGRLVVVASLVVGFWRVGADPEVPRLGGLRQLITNVSDDLAYARGEVDRPTFLRRFKGAQKYDAFEIDRLSTLVSGTTRPDDRILVFGFSPGVYVKSGRASASRFHWSRPVVIEFAADHPGYGSAGLLADLTRTAPALVALQKKDWGMDPTSGANTPKDEPNSLEFFMGRPALREWLESGYVLEDDNPVFSVWRRRS